ncbi:hypothetical protein [Evansella tamaricis]|uniref:HK97 gp10 family phage protein n=1 Tax=Evansella tamaricis TaxID=2069301 RepID=A0ABS6JM17_9BACI|nr:hypothetical protein [Evansella tamaricis]MBU9714420.1 hypothetical protein [Evansella tamaricis]
MATYNMSFDDLAKMLNSAPDKLEAKLIEGMTENAEDLLSVSQQLAPLEEGGLMESGSIEQPQKVGNEIQAKVGYSKEYALRRHEDIYQLGPVSAKKPKVDGMHVGRKFLEKPSKKYGEMYSERLMEKSKEVF